MGGNHPGRSRRVGYHVELNDQLQVLLLPVFGRVAQSGGEKLGVGDQSRSAFGAVLHAAADQDQHGMCFRIERPRDHPVILVRMVFRRLIVRIPLGGLAIIPDHPVAAVVHIETEFPGYVFPLRARVSNQKP